MALLLSLLVPAGVRAEAQAVHPLTHGGAASFGLAGSHRAASGNLDNVWHGAAVLALEPRYDIVTDGFIDPGTWKGFKVAARDSRTSAVTMGLVYSYAHTADLPMDEADLPGWKIPGGDSENAAFAQQVAAGLAWAPGEEDRVALGVHGGWFWRRAEVSGDGAGLRLGASVAGRPHETVTLSLAGTLPLLVDGFDGQEDLPWAEAGARWHPVKPFAVEVDAALPLREVDGLDLGVGVEALAADIVPFRLGYARCAGDVQHALGAGLGLASEALDLQYGIWVDLGAGGDTAAEPGAPRHALTLSIRL